MERTPPPQEVGAVHLGAMPRKCLLFLRRK